MKFLNKPFGSEKLFQDFSDSEKRELLNWDQFFLTSEKKRRDGKLKVVDLSGAQPLAKRLSDRELDTLIEIRKLMSNADSTTGSKAIALYKKVLKLAPWDEICLMSIGVEYAEAGNFKEGIQWLQKAMAMNPNNERVRKNLEAVKAATNQ